MREKPETLIALIERLDELHEQYTESFEEEAFIYWPCISEAVKAMREKLSVIWNTVPASHEPKDDLVRLHAHELNSIRELLAHLDQQEKP